MSVDGPPSSAPALPEITENGENTPTEGPESVQAGVDDTPKPDGTDTKPGDSQVKPDGDAQVPMTEPSEDQPADAQAAAAEPMPQPPATSSWRWFGWPVQPAPSSLAGTETKPDEVKQADSSASDSAEPPAVESTPPTETPAVEQPVPQVPPPSDPEVAEEKPAPAPVAGSWFGFWPGGGAVSAPTAAVPQPDATPEVAPLPEPNPPANEVEDVVMQDAPPIDAAPNPTPKAGSTWAFWSRDTGSTSSQKSTSQAEPGQLAVIGDSSERHPKRANSMEFRKEVPVKEPPLKPAAKDDQAKAVVTPSRETSKKNKRTRPLSMGTDEITNSRPSTPKPESSSKAEPAAKAGPSKTPVAAKALPPNILLPSFKSTYRLKENPSIVKQIAQLLLRTQQSPPKHVFLAKEQPKIKKAIAIGVHGLFPANYLRPMIGQPTGTSIKFANHCAEAIRRWADSHGCEDCEIEKVALEGEGRIGDRVENLWRLLLNWIDHIRTADVIVFGCHSQGVPVTLMLLAKLLELGIITTAKVGVCAMAGVSLGPFPDYRSSMGILMGSAAELWEFSDPQSEISKRLEASIKAVLNHGARITFVGSIDDQLVPLESAIYAPAHHPYIYRAVFIDGRIHAPDFIAHLVGFAMKLRNLGVSDHGLIRELSTPLAGSLYSGEGHSRLYDDEQVYDLAVTHALETADVSTAGCEVHQRQGHVHPPNPYHLPWIMRGLLEEDFVRTELNSETAELLRQFDDWKPTTKALKDVKYRLEAVRSKL